MDFHLARPFHLRIEFLAPVALLVVALLALSAGALWRRSRQRAQLRESETNFRQLAENIREVFWLLDWRAREMLYVSPTYADVWGRPLEPLLEDSGGWFETVHPEDRERVTEAFERDAATGAYQVEYRIQHGDGGVRWIRERAFPIRDRDGVVYRVAGISEDCTFHKQSELALKESKERYQALVETVPDAIFIHRDGRFLYANPAGVALLGARSAHELIGEPVMKIIHPDYREVVARRLRAAQHEGISAPRLEQKLVRLGGEEIDVEISAHPVIFDGAPAVQAFARDITERKRAAERQTLLTRELDHRVKNNLAGVIAIAEQSLAHSRDFEQFGQSFSGRIHAMARAHEALAGARWEGVELGEILRLVTTPFISRHAEQVSIAGPSLLVRASATSGLSMALHELTTNAVKHGALADEKGRLQVRWRVRGRGRGRLELEWVENGAIVRALPQRKGLGLSLVRGVVEHELGGEASFEFARTGFVCRLSLPAEAVLPGSEGEPSRAAEVGVF